MQCSNALNVLRIIIKIVYHPLKITQNKCDKRLPGIIIIVKKIKMFVFFFSILLLTYSCGQKGPLIMPEKKYPSSNEGSKENNE